MKHLLIIWAIASIASIGLADEGKKEAPAKTEVATLAAGCFWCTEAVFERIPGVVRVTSGYTGGKVKNPTYDDVKYGKSGHAEATEIEFNPAVVKFETILDTFFDTHDPTTLNQQGADRGSQYRSAIFYHSDEQKKGAEESMKAAQKDQDDPIVTEISKASTFYPAERYHQNYYKNNPYAGYSRYIKSKLKKFDLDKAERVVKE